MGGAYIYYICNKLQVGPTVWDEPKDTDKLHVGLAGGIAVRAVGLEVHDLLCGVKVLALGAHVVLPCCCPCTLFFFSILLHMAHRPHCHSFKSKLKTFLFSEYFS